MFKQLFDLSGRVAVVTGGGRNIGLSTASALAEFGAKVVIAEMAVSKGIAHAGTSWTSPTARP